MSKRREILKQAGIYLLSTQVAQLITIVTAILSRRFLGPIQMGVWTTLQIIVEYSKFSTMGLLHGIAREIPYYVGKGKSEVAEEIKNVVFTTVLGGTFLIASLLFLFALMTKGRFSTEVTYGLLLISIVVILQRLNDLFIGLVRCYKKFTLASSQMIWSATINAILVALLTYFFKIYGFIWAVIFSFVFNILYIHLRNNFRFHIQFSAKRFRALVIFGFPLMMIGIITTALRSIDKIMIAKFLGFEALGFYSIAYMVCTYIGSFTNSTAVVLIPHFQEKFAVSDNPRDLRDFLYKASNAYALTTPLIIGLSWVLAPYFITLLLPKFRPGIQAMQILTLSMYFLSLTQPYSDFLITIKKHFYLFPLLGITVFTLFLFNYLAIRSGYGITGVAGATTFSSLISFSITYFFASRYVANMQIAFKKYILLLGCGTYLVVILFLINRWLPSDFYSFTRTSMQFLLFSGFSIPFLILLNRQFSIISLIKEKYEMKKYVSSESILKVVSHD